MSGIRHIVFDIGKVLVHYDPEIPYRRLIPDEERRRWFLANVCTPAWNIEQDRGRRWTDAEALLIADYPDEADNIRGFRRYWHEMVPHPHDGSVALLEGLIKRGRDVTLLTNAASDTFAEMRERFAFLKKPRGATVSGDVGLIKPERAIYDHHAATFELEPPATILIDDNPHNVDGAKAAGWHAVRFTDAVTLAEHLRSFGVEA
ncbi:MAG: HAD family phosphatase [Rhodospirillales bacterium]|nr:HAD family phosphatase [Rhodospirillales bacterium]